MLDACLSPIGKMYIHSHVTFFINEVNKCEDKTFSVFLNGCQPCVKSDGDSIRKIWGNETGVQHHPVISLSCMLRETMPLKM